MLRSASIGYSRPAATGATIAIYGCISAWLRAAAAVWLFLSISAFAGAQAKPSQYDAKASYLVNFGKFVRFGGAPQQRDATFDICLLGGDPFGQALDRLAANESVNRRRQRILRISDATSGRQCQILFISGDDSDKMREDLATLSGADTLTVSDASDFLAQGGMIQFITEGDRVRFAVNLEAVNRTHLVLSSELLRVAVSVKGKPEAPR